MLGDGPGGFVQLLQGGQVGGEGRFSADLFGLGAFGHRPVVVAAGQPMQRRADADAEDIGGLGVTQGGQLADRVDAQPVQLLLGNRSDAPQPAHREACQQDLFLIAPDHPDPVGFCQSGGDLGDLLA